MWLVWCRDFVLGLSYRFIFRWHHRLLIALFLLIHRILRLQVDIGKKVPGICLSNCDCNVVLILMWNLKRDEEKLTEKNQNK